MIADLAARLVRSASETVHQRWLPYPAYNLARRLRPVMHARRPDLWVLWDHASVRRALHDHDTFSSRAAPPGKEPLPWMIFQDPPRHTALRALVLRTFVPRAIAALEPRVRSLAGALIERSVAGGAMDLVADFAGPLPLLVIAEMLGLPADDRPRLRDWSEAILGLGDAVFGGERAARATARFRAASDEMEAYLPRLLNARRERPEDDLLTRLLAAEVDGERLDRAEILDFVQLLLLAGSETTTNLIGNAVLTLIEHPTEQARLRLDPALLPAAIEEVLRFRSPVQMVFRATRRPVELHGRTLPAGKLVLAMIGSANRDPAAFAEPDRFRIDRSPNPHVAFGHGIHFCIGAALARLEARVALEELLARTEGWALAGPRTSRRALNVHGPARLPIRFRPTGRNPEVG